MNYKLDGETIAYGYFASSICDTASLRKNLINYPHGERGIEPLIFCDKMYIPINSTSGVSNRNKNLGGTFSHVNIFTIGKITKRYGFIFCVKTVRASSLNSNFKLIIFISICFWFGSHTR